MHPDRVVIGAGPESADFADRVEALYGPLGGELVRTDVASAEMIKLASNAFLATKISFINEIANISEEFGADVNEVARGMGLDDRIGPKFLQAGIGWGGSLFREGCAVPQATCQQLRLPLPASYGRHGGERPSEAADDRQAPEASRVARRQEDRAARHLVQAAHRRHPRCDEPRARAAPARRGRARARSTTPLPRERAEEMLGRHELCKTAWRRSTVRTLPCS